MSQTSQAQYSNLVSMIGRMSIGGLRHGSMALVLPFLAHLDKVQEELLY